ncbi:hypothetical protein MMPV_008974 [Pyropia vietnamensis]
MGGSRSMFRAAAGAAAVALVASAGGFAVATDRCEAITHFNVIALRDFHQTASEVLGPLAVGGNARLNSFAINPAGKCGRDGRVPDEIALVVAGDLRAHNGQINNGKVLVGGRRAIRDDVGLRCARVVSIKEDLSFDGLESWVTESHEELCDTREDNCRTRVDDARGITLTIRDGGPATCVVKARDLGRASRLAIVGRRRDHRVIIKVDGDDRDDDGEALTLTNFGLDGFVPTHTVMAFCDVRKLIIDNVGIPSAVFAPKTALSGPAGHILGTTVVESFRGGVEFQHAPYDCNQEDRAEPSPEARD